MSLLSAVAPRNDPYAGGSITPASDPRAVGGTIGGPGSAANFPAVPAAQILSARNNSGSNVRVPYARLVPLRARTTNGPGAEGVDWNKIPGLNTRADFDMNGRIIQGESDGLESGELAWILGRRFGGTGSFDKDGRPTGAAASAHGLGMGYGVDRMQRLAYTSWVEGFFRASHGATAFRLDLLPISNVISRAASHEIRSHAAVLAGSVVTGGVDLPHVINKTFLDVERLKVPGGADPVLLKYHTNVSVNEVNGEKVVNSADVDATARGIDGGLSCGLFVMEEGPFLRGKIVEDMPVSMVAPESRADENGRTIRHTVPRNLGDSVAFEALYAEMRQRALFDWQPDGMVLSKLESPSGDPLGSAELDARQAQLFNLAIQGPAIAKTWTGDPLQQTMPMDKVFICIVADVQSVVATKPGDPAASAAAEGGKPEVLKKSLEEFQALIAALKDPDTDPAALTVARGKVEDEINKGSTITPGDALKIGNYAKSVHQQFKDAGVPLKDATSGDWGAAGDAAFAQLNMTDWRKLAAKLRTGRASVTNSTMCNFRLMRATSSYLAQYSRAKMGAGGALDRKSRCGLRIGTAVGATADAATATAEYIVGAWCIGTVIDNSASRSTVGHLVRIAPASMAINISVNIEFWSGDKLYRHYMDVSRDIDSAPTVHTRSERAATGSDADAKRSVNLEVPEADLPEKVAWAWKK